MSIIDTRLREANNYIRKGYDKLAISLIEDTLVKFPKNIRLKEKLKHISTNHSLKSFKNSYLLEDVNQVISLIEEKKYDLAYSKSRQILTNNKNNAIVLKVAAMVDYEIGNIQNSINLYKLSIDINPYDHETVGNMGLAYAKIGETKKAIELYNKGISLNPKGYVIYNNLATLYNKVGQYDLSIENFLKAIKYSPQNSDIYQNLGVSYREKNIIEKAKESFFKSIELNPNNLNAYNNLGILYRNLGDYTNALSICEKGINLDPNFADLCMNYGTILSEVGEHEKALTWLQKCLVLNPSEQIAISNLLLISNYIYSITPHKLNYFHKRYGHNFSLLNVKNENNYDKNKINLVNKTSRFRIGYVSGDFHNHSVSYFFKPLLSSINKNNFETFCYYNAFINDDMTSKLKKLSDNWRDVAKLTDEQLYSLIKADGIDLLIDLSGHTNNNRLSVFAMKPSNKQATWLGYPNTTGIKNMDYRIVDKFTDLNENDHLNIEKLYKLETPFLCYEGDEDIYKAENPPVLENKHITFGSFNNLSKLSDELICIWSKILLKIPNSKLILKNKQLNSSFIRNFYYEKFLRFGVSKKSLELLGWKNTKSSHLEVYNKIDIALDTYPYHGTTTTFESLWMGVPVISWVGEKHSNRVGYTILKNLELNDLLANDEENYINKVIHLSQNIEDLTYYKKNLRIMLKNSVLCNGELHAKSMESCYYKILASS